MKTSYRADFGAFGVWPPLRASRRTRLDGRPRATASPCRWPLCRRSLLRARSAWAAGVDPSSRTPNDPSEIIVRASTADHNLGTTKAGLHPPGYSGFIPATTNTLAGFSVGLDA